MVEVMTTAFCRELTWEGHMEKASQTQYVVAYAKIITDKEKEKGISLGGVYFGGVGDTFEDAEKIARECVNTIKGGVILPKVVKMISSETIIDALYDAEERFEKLINGMMETEEIINRNKRQKK